MYLATLDCATSNPSLSSSPWMRGAPQSKFSMLIPILLPDKLGYGFRYTQGFTNPMSLSADGPMKLMLLTWISENESWETLNVNSQPAATAIPTPTALATTHFPIRSRRASHTAQASHRISLRISL